MWNLPATYGKHCHCKTHNKSKTQFKFLKLVKHTIRCHPNLLNLATKPKYLSKLK